MWVQIWAVSRFDESVWDEGYDGEEDDKRERSQPELTGTSEKDEHGESDPVDKVGSGIVELSELLPSNSYGSAGTVEGEKETFGELPVEGVTCHLPGADSLVVVVGCTGGGGGARNVSGATVSNEILPSIPIRWPSAWSSNPILTSSAK